MSRILVFTAILAVLVSFARCAPVMPTTEPTHEPTTVNATTTTIDSETTTVNATTAETTTTPKPTTVTTTTAKTTKARATLNTRTYKTGPSNYLLVPDSSKDSDNGTGLVIMLFVGLPGVVGLCVLWAYCGRKRF